MQISYTAAEQLYKPGQSLFLSVTLNKSHFSAHSHYSLVEVTCSYLVNALANFSVFSCITCRLSLTNYDKQSPKATVEEQQQTDKLFVYGINTQCGRKQKNRKIYIVPKSLQVIQYSKLSHIQDTKHQRCKERSNFNRRN